MNKVAMVLGVAAVATLAGCKDPEAVKTAPSAQDQVKQVPTEEKVAPAPQIKEVTPPVKPSCQCAPGTKHTSPCKCGADDCLCIVEVKTRKPIEPEYTIYYVQSGDYLAKISKKFNVSLSSIKRLNNMTKDMIRVGQKLKIPGKVDVGAAQSKPAPVAKPTRKAAKKGYASYTGATKEYVVKNGDTLGGIAYSNGINIRQLKELNGLTKDQLRIGQKLKVPAVKVAKAPVAKPAATKAATKPSVAEKPVSADVAKPAVDTPAPAADATPVESAPAAESVPADAAPAVDAAKPAEAAPVTEPAPATTTYVVQPNEDIQAVAIRFGITTSEIRELNNLGETDTVKAGQAIKLPAEAQQ